uniref:Uncharacterized protein n=1 Tax=Glossina pallidipes TaxID=7398 RepID=A0A1B0AF98_GLOPL
MPPKINRKRKALNAPNEHIVGTKSLKLENSNTDYSRSSEDASDGKNTNHSHSIRKENNGEFVMSLRFKNREAALNAIRLLFVDVQMREFFYRIPKERDEYWQANVAKRRKRSVVVVINRISKLTRTGDQRA